MSQSKTKFDSTKLKETVRRKCSNKMVTTGFLMFVAASIVATVCFVLLVGNKSNKEGKHPFNISLCASYKIDTAIILVYKLICGRRVEKNKILRSASSEDINGSPSYLLYYIKEKYNKECKQPFNISLCTS